MRVLITIVDTRLGIRLLGGIRAVYLNDKWIRQNLGESSRAHSRMISNPASTWGESTSAVLNPPERLEAKSTGRDA